MQLLAGHFGRNLFALHYKCSKCLSLSIKLNAAYCAYKNRLKTLALLSSKTYVPELITKLFPKRNEKN